jgi:hypothetical protein
VTDDDWGYECCYVVEHRDHRFMVSILGGVRSPYEVANVLEAILFRAVDNTPDMEERIDSFAGGIRNLTGTPLPIPISLCTGTA